MNDTFDYMNNTWDYKVELEDLLIFNELEQEYNITFPEVLKEFIINCNGTMPKKSRFMVGTTERVLGEILSFNKSDYDLEDTNSLFDVLECMPEMIKNNGIIPFAEDPFGNLIAYSLADGTVVLLDHETDKITSTGKSLKDLIESLY